MSHPDDITRHVQTYWQCIADTPAGRCGACVTRRQDLTRRAGRWYPLCAEHTGAPDVNEWLAADSIAGLVSNRLDTRRCALTQGDGSEITHGAAPCAAEAQVACLLRPPVGTVVFGDKRAVQAAFTAQLSKLPGYASLALRCLQEIHNTLARVYDARDVLLYGKGSTALRVLLAELVPLMEIAQDLPVSVMRELYTEGLSTAEVKPEHTMYACVVCCKCARFISAWPSTSFHLGLFQTITVPAPF